MHACSPLTSLHGCKAERCAPGPLLACSLLPRSSRLTSLCLTYRAYDHMASEVDYSKNGSLAALAVSVRRLPALQVRGSWAVARSKLLGVLCRALCSHEASLRLLLGVPPGVRCSLQPLAARP